VKVREIILQNASGLSNDTLGDATHQLTQNLRLSSEEMEEHDGDSNAKQADCSLSSLALQLPKRRRNERESDIANTKVDDGKMGMSFTDLSEFFHDDQKDDILPFNFLKCVFIVPNE